MSKLLSHADVVESKYFLNLNLFIICYFVRNIYFVKLGETNENFVVRMSNLLHLVTQNLTLSTSKVFKAAEDTMARYVKGFHSS